MLTDSSALQVDTATSTTLPVDPMLLRLARLVKLFRLLRLIRQLSLGKRSSKPVELRLFCPFAALQESERL